MKAGADFFQPPQISQIQRKTNYVIVFLFIPLLPLARNNGGAFLLFG
ncbi:hypothetical protein NEILACOT_04108 [Neisseria lactamica ATCC 23970]|uniref:Uncharacterized protein n=1 Tax=Neisseria lactamica ATCC 23970 TaxID=546265 RepID=D0W9A0_NEILA|nr:hypothetical protein NEILACOT_04108 [Neisseria lactamica ATCC 23970]